MSKTITQIELARLAATLAKDGDDATRLTRRAFELWEASGKELDCQKARATLREQTDPHSITINEPGKPPLTITIPPWPQDLKRAMTLKEFLRSMLPKLSVAARTKRYRDYLRAQCRDADEKRQLDYVQKEIEQAKAQGFNASDYQQEARAFLRWETARAKQAGSRRGLSGALALKAKVAAKKAKLAAKEARAR
jgi:hypothetical protein